MLVHLNIVFFILDQNHFVSFSSIYLLLAVLGKTCL
uniref:Uncharacterized protein n=1 Tax=Anguilla anguilla TaxID=7936 RepID=A0A0E9VK27_ANGAN